MTGLGNEKVTVSFLYNFYTFLYWMVTSQMVVQTYSDICLDGDIIVNNDGNKVRIVINIRFR